MKKTIWAISILALAVALSLLFRFGLCPHHLANFPVFEDQKKVKSPFALYFFFSEHSCPACMEMADVLNRLTDDFPIIGVVPEFISRGHGLTGAGYPGPSCRSLA